MRTPIYNSGKYMWIWEKYRPVILKLMITSSDGPQTYQLSAHEFMDVNNKKPTGYTFMLKVFQGRSQNDIKKNPVAQELLSALRNSYRAEELMESIQFEFELDKHFVIKVKQIPAP